MSFNQLLFSVCWLILHKPCLPTSLSSFWILMLCKLQEIIRGPWPAEYEISHNGRLLQSRHVDVLFIDKRPKASSHFEKPTAQERTGRKSLLKQEHFGLDFWQRRAVFCLSTGLRKCTHLIWNVCAIKTFAFKIVACYIFFCCYILTILQAGLEWACLRSAHISRATEILSNLLSKMSVSLRQTCFFFFVFFLHLASDL